MSRTIKTLRLNFIAILSLLMLICLVRTESAFCFQSIPRRLSREAPSDTDRIGRIPPKKILAKGKFLVAARKLKDPNFSETVVVLIQYDPNGGAVGVIVNRPSELKLSKVLPDLKMLQKRNDTIFFGGPVSRNQILLLVQTDVDPGESEQVFKNVYVSPNPKIIEQMIKNEDKGNRFRVYAGYAGWAPGQLDQEVQLGYWHILPASSDVIFNKAPAEIWPDLIQRGSVKYVKK